jgi:hypothetical protein
VLLDNQIVVQPNGNSLSKQVYTGTSAPDAWSAFIKEVDKVYGQMCIDWLNEKDASVAATMRALKAQISEHEIPAEQKG